jgi:hypothetical protein
MAVIDDLGQQVISDIGPLTVLISKHLSCYCHIGISGLRNDVFLDGNIGPATIADSVGDALQPRYPTSITQYSASPVYPPMQIMNHQNYGTGLSQETILKIAELKRLVNKYPQFHTIDADEIVKGQFIVPVIATTSFLMTC